MRKYIYLVFTAVTAGIISFAGKNGTMELTNNNGKAGFTGSPGEQTCTSCHSGTINSGSGNVMIATNIPPAGYTAGQTYQIDVTVTDGTSNLFGFGFEALLASNNTNAGSFTITNSASTQIKTASVSGNMRNNVVHTLNGGTGSGQKVFTFNWTAPATGSGEVNFYAVGNAANGNNGTSGDKIYSATSSFIEFNSSSIDAENHQIQDINVFPNPSSDLINVSLQVMKETDVVLALTDLSGKTIATTTLQNVSGKMNQTLSFPSNISKGLYLLTIKAVEFSKTEKVFIK